VQPIRAPEDLAQIPIEDGEGNAVITDGQLLRLGDVTEVVEDHQPLIGDALFPDGGGLLLVIEKFPGAHTLEVTEGVEEAFHAMEPGLSGIRVDTSLFRPADYIENSTGNLVRTLGIGAILLLLALAIMFFEWRAVVTSSVVILLSIVAAGSVLYVRDAPANTMVLAGLVLAIGILIDDAVADVRNLKERLRQHREEGRGTPAWRTVLDADRMRSAACSPRWSFAALAPLLPRRPPAGFVPAPRRRFVHLAIAASMVVALTLAGAGHDAAVDGSAERRESPVVRWLRAFRQVDLRADRSRAGDTRSRASWCSWGSWRCRSWRHPLVRHVQGDGPAGHWDAAPARRSPR
jgi:multidrug efflux pump subunit AcrB